MTIPQPKSIWINAIEPAVMPSIAPADDKKKGNETEEITPPALLKLLPPIEFQIDAIKR